MPRFGIVGPSYTSQSLNADAQMCMNWYVEQIESGAGNAPVVMYPTPGTLTFVNLGRTVTPGVDGLGALDAAVGATGFGTAVATGALTPSTTPEFALFGEAKDDTSGFIFTPNAGWTVFGSQPYEQEATGKINGQGTIGGGSANWATALALFKQIGATAPTIIQTKTINSGTFAAGVYTQSFTLPVTAGNSIIVILEGNLSSGDAAMTISDGWKISPKVI